MCPNRQEARLPIALRLVETRWSEGMRGSMPTDLEQQNQTGHFLRAGTVRRYLISAIA